MSMDLTPLTIIALGFALAVATTAQAAPTTLSADDLSGLQRQSSSQFDEVYARSGIDQSGFRVEAVLIGIESASERRLLGTRDLERLRSSFEASLESNSANGNAAVTLQVTLVELVPNNIITETNTRTSRYNRSSGIGRASMEAVFRDATTGEVLMVIVDNRTGAPLTHNFNTMNHKIWGDVTDILEAWAEELPTVL